MKETNKRSILIAVFTFAVHFVLAHDIPLHEQLPAQRQVNEPA
jgi:hypothetical protein